MSDPIDASAAARALRAVIDQQPGWADLVSRSRPPMWYWPMLSAVVLLLDGKPADYISGQLDDDRNGSLIVYGTGALIDVEVQDGRSDDGTANVTAHSRRGLVSVAASASEGPHPSEVFNHWPGTVTIVATYANGRVVSLPAATPREQDLRDHLEAFLPSLVADLGR